MNSWQAATPAGILKQYKQTLQRLAQPRPPRNPGCTCQRQPARQDGRCIRATPSMADQKLIWAPARTESTRPGASTTAMGIARSTTRSLRAPTCHGLTGADAEHRL